MSTTTPFRDLPGRPKVVLPKWELRKDKEEVTYTLKTCRGIPQNCVHDVSEPATRQRKALDFPCPWWPLPYHRVHCCGCVMVFVIETAVLPAVCSCAPSRSRDLD